MLSNTLKPRHRVERRFLSSRGMLTVASAIAGVTLIGLGAAGSTYALWTGSAPISDYTVNSGSQDLTVEGVKSFALAGSWTKMLPGDRVTAQVNVKNGFTGPSAVVATSSATSNFDVRVAKGACLGTALGVTPASLGDWAANESSPVCIQLTLKPTAVESASENFTVTLVATQKAS